MPDVYTDNRLTIAVSERRPKQEGDLLIPVSSPVQVERGKYPLWLKTLLLGRLAEGKAGTLCLYRAKGRVVLAIAPMEKWVREPREVAVEHVRRLGADLYALMLREDIREIHTVGMGRYLGAENARALLEGMLLSSYRFSRYKTSANEASPKQRKLLVGPRAVGLSTLKELQYVADAVALCRSMVNEPPVGLDARRFAALAQHVAAGYGIRIRVWGKDELIKLGMGGILAVNRGSAVPPVLVELTYRGSTDRKTHPMVWVGKGITFDSGGYSIKTGGHMQDMKSDMAGGAAVLAAMQAVAANKLDCHIIGLIPVTDNRIGPDALVVDDIITMHDGTTVEVANTDAEGRLVLADALAYAKQFEPDLAIDVATLTGASAAVTGPYGTAMMGTDERYMEMLAEAGEDTYERVIAFPFWDEFTELLESDVADLKNVGGPVGGASTAGKFLHRFTAYPWIHLDIAGAAFRKTAKHYLPKGGTGVGVRLLYRFTKHYIEYKKRKSSGRI